MSQNLDKLFCIKKINASKKVRNKILFETTISVLVNHLNYGNHLGHDAMLCILQEARMRWLKSLTNNTSELYIQNNIGWLVKRIEIDILSESFHGDVLQIQLSVDENKQSHFIIDYCVKNLTRNEEQCRAKTQMVCYDFQNKKIARIPDVILNILN